MATRFAWLLAVTLLACLVSEGAAEVPATPESNTPSDAFLRPAQSIREPVDPASDEVPNPVCIDEPKHPCTPNWLLHPRLEGTQLLKFGERGLGVTETEARLGIDIPFLNPDAPLKIIPAAGARWFEGPVAPFGTPRPDLPPWVTDFYVDLTWRPRLAEWLFIDMRVTPGFYSDLQNTSSDAFRMRGHGMAIIALSEKFQILLGVAYINRYNYKVVPLGGIRWVPNEDTELRLFVPAPRITHRIAWWGDAKVNVYLTGDYGGGIWAIRRENGQDDSVDYSDFRLVSGIEAEFPGNRRWFAEVGYVFNRRIDYVSNVPTTFRPTDTIMFRMGVAY